MQQQHPDPDWRDTELGWTMGSDRDTRMPPEKFSWVGPAVMLIAAGVFAFIFFLMLHTAHAEDLQFLQRAPHHGFDPNNETVKWFERLERPWCAPSVEHCFCCGHVDAYPVVIDQEATINGEEDDGIAHVTDPSRKEFPDKTYRDELIGDLTFHFKGKDVVKLEAGNPTSTAWAFLGNMQGHITLVWCVVPLPPGV